MSEKLPQSKSIVCRAIKVMRIEFTFAHFNVLRTFCFLRETYEKQET